MEKPNFDEITNRLKEYSQNLKENAQIGNSKLILALAELITVMQWSSSQQDTNNIQTANLIEEVKTLNKITFESNLQSQKLQKSNYSLQLVMLFLTGATSLVILFPIIKLIIQWIIPIITQYQQLSMDVISLIAGAVSVLTIFAAMISFRKNFSQDLFLNDSVKLSDNVEIIVKDKNGNIKRN